MVTPEVAATRLPVQVPGVHLWVLQGLWLVNPLVEAGHLGIDNLVQLAGPLCYWCEQPYSPDLASRPCRPERTSRHT